VQTLSLYLDSKETQHVREVKWNCAEDEPRTQGPCQTCRRAHQQSRIILQMLLPRDMELCHIYVWSIKKIRKLSPLITTSMPRKDLKAETLD